MDINHLHLKVRSVDRAQRFYESFFGLREYARHGEVLFLRDGAGMDFALAPSAAPVQPPRGFHFGFRLETAAEVERLYENLMSGRVQITEALGREHDLVSFRCADSDGYSIEVYWQRPPSGA